MAEFFEGVQKKHELMTALFECFTLTMVVSDGSHIFFLRQNVGTRCFMAV